ncbi:MAG: hypothetical protein IPL84_04875 [Chitinophagaceae bacterium]|nr:hypothetical protein [Chitinophagaceae bacterium]
MGKNKTYRGLLTSIEAKVALKISDCDLAHHRNAGEVKFVKKGNAFMYLESSIIGLKKVIKNIS